MQNATVMSTRAVGEQLVALCRQGRNLDAVNTLYHPDVVSLEATELPNLPREMRGVDAVRAKNEGWFEQNEVHETEVRGPYVGDDGFAVRHRFEYTRRATGERVHFSEMALYTVRDGKIVREEFFYDASGA